MGNTPNKHLPPLNKIQFELVCSKTFYHVQIARDRKINDLQKKENALRDVLQNGPPNGPSIIHEAANCISTLNNVQGTNIVMRNINMLKENSMAVCNAIAGGAPLGQMEPLLHSVVWSTKRLNLDAVKEFSDCIATYMNHSIYDIVETSPLIDLELKKKFATLIASPIEIQDYLEKFCQRNSISPTVLGGIYGGTPSQAGGIGQGGFNNSPGPGYASGGFQGAEFGGLPPNGFAQSNDDDFMRQLNNLSLSGGNNAPPPHPGMGGGLPVGGQPQPVYAGNVTNPFATGAYPSPVAAQMGTPGLISFDNRIAELRKLGA